MVSDRHRAGAGLHNTTFLGSGKPRVDKIPLEHHEVLLEDRENYDGVLAWLL